MHSSQIGDFVRAKVVQPIGDDLKAATAAVASRSCRSMAKAFRCAPTWC